MVLGTYGCNKVYFGSLLTIFRQRLIDQFQQEWNSELSTKERLDLYASFKRRFQGERYMEYSQLRCYREAYIQFRFGISPILIHKQRYRKYVISRNLLCPVCKRKLRMKPRCFSLANSMMNTETMLKCSGERLQGIHLTWLGLCQQTTKSLYSSYLGFCTEYYKEENKAQTKKWLIERTYCDQKSMLMCSSERSKACDWRNNLC